MIMQRAISRRRWCPYDSVPAGRFATDVSPIRSSHTAARSSAFLLGTAIRGRREQAGQQPRLHLAVLRDEQVLDDGQRLEQADVLERARRPFNAILWLGSPPIAWRRARRRRRSA